MKGNENLLLLNNGELIKNLSGDLFQFEYFKYFACGIIYGLNTETLYINHWGKLQKKLVVVCELRR